MPVTGIPSPMMRSPDTSSRVLSSLKMSSQLFPSVHDFVMMPTPPTSDNSSRSYSNSIGYDRALERQVNSPDAYANQSEKPPATLSEMESFTCATCGKTFERHKHFKRHEKLHNMPERLLVESGSGHSLESLKNVREDSSEPMYAQHQGKSEFDNIYFKSFWTEEPDEFGRQLPSEAPSEAPLAYIAPNPALQTTSQPEILRNLGDFAHKTTDIAECTDFDIQEHVADTVASHDVLGESISQANIIFNEGKSIPSWGIQQHINQVPLSNSANISERIFEGSMSRRFTTRYGSNSISKDTTDINLSPSENRFDTLNYHTNSPSTGNSPSEGELSFTGLPVSTQFWEPMIGHVDEATEHFVRQLAENIYRRCTNWESQSKYTSRSPGHQGSSGSSAQGSSKETPPTSIAPSNKRSRENEDDSEGYGERDRDNGGERPSSKRMREEELKDKLLACPYSKVDPQRYSNRNLVEMGYRGCSSCWLTDIPRLKQHLYRVHKRPEYYCGSCYAIFKTRHLLDAHTRQRPPCQICPSRFPEKMTDDQSNAIKRRNMGGKVHEEWYKIFKILFPNAALPASPYASPTDSITVSHFVSLFRWFGPEEFFNLMRDHREQGRGGIVPPLDSTTQTLIDEAFELVLPRYLHDMETAPTSSAPTNQHDQSVEFPRQTTGTQAEQPTLDLVPSFDTQIATFNQQTSTGGDGIFNLQGRLPAQSYLPLAHRNPVDTNLPSVQAYFQWNNSQPNYNRLHQPTNISPPFVDVTNSTAFYSENQYTDDVANFDPTEVEEVFNNFGALGG